MCGSSLLQGFILSCWPVWPNHMSCRSMFSSSDGADIPLCTAAACLPVLAPLIALVCLMLSFIHEVSNLANDFSLQILLFSLESKAHSFFPHKSYSKTLMSSLFSSLKSPEKHCTGWQPLVLFFVIGLGFFYLLQERPEQGYFAGPFSINNNTSLWALICLKSSIYMVCQVPCGLRKYFH